MRQNFSFNKRRREEAKKRKREEKKIKRLNQKTESPALDPQFPDQNTPTDTQANPIDPVL